MPVERQGHRLGASDKPGRRSTSDGQQVEVEHPREDLLLAEAALERCAQEGSVVLAEAVFVVKRSIPEPGPRHHSIAIRGAVAWVHSLAVHGVAVWKRNHGRRMLAEHLEVGASRLQLCEAKILNGFLGSGLASIHTQAHLLQRTLVHIGRLRGGLAAHDIGNESPSDRLRHAVRRVTVLRRTGSRAHITEVRCDCDAAICRYVQAGDLHYGSTKRQAQPWHDRRCLKVLGSDWSGHELLRIERYLELQIVHSAVGRCAAHEQVRLHAVRV